MNQVGKGNVAVVCPPGPYDNNVHPEDPAAPGGNQQYGQDPPDYSEGLEDNAFSDGAIRRGEGRVEGGREGWRHGERTESERG